MGRPARGPMGSFDKALVGELDRLRSQCPGWGAGTLLAELGRTGRWAKEELPGRSTVCLYLRENKLTRAYEPHVELPAEPLKKATRCHSLWQIDGQGNVHVANVGAVAMLNLVDVVSKVHVASFPAAMKSMQGHPCGNDYQAAMRLGFIQHGRPLRVQSDHASVFYDNGHKSPFPTVFFLWLTALGIQPCFSRVHRPTDQGQVERSHQTVFNQVLKGRGYRNWGHLFEEAQKRRCALNGIVPNSACGNMPPLKKYPKAKHSGRFYHPHRENGLLDLDRVYGALAKGKWFRRVAGNRTVTLGGHYYYVPGTKQGEQLLITFCKKKRELLFRNDKELLVARIPVKGISKERLMGDLGLLARFPSLQLEIPFDWKAIKVNTTLSDFG